MKKLKVGLVSLSHENFTGDKEGQFTRSVQELTVVSDKLGFDLYVLNKKIYREQEAIEAKKELEEQKVDFVLFHATAFPAGLAVPILASINAYIGLWAIPESRMEGKLPFNSFCGINMMASIIGEYMQGRDIPFKWFYGNGDDEMFIKRFEITVKSLTAIVNLKNSRIALIGGIANGFDNQYFDERKLHKRFGMRLYRNHEFSEIKNKALSYKTEDVKELMDSIRADSCFIAPLAEEAMEKNARVVKAIKEIKEENGYDALTISCWPKFRTELQMVACAAIGRLNQEGIVTACEGDVYGLVTMMAMNFISRQPTLLTDLTVIDDKDESALFWHCGVGCRQLAYGGKMWLSPHFNPSPWIGGVLTDAAPVCESVFSDGPATVARFTKEGDELFLLSGNIGNHEKKSHDGSRGWLYNMKLNGKEISARDLRNTVMVQQMQHHYAFGVSDMHNEMIELAAWLGTKSLEKVPYEHYLQLRCEI